MEPLEPGDPVQVGVYRLLGRLGAGGMGQVFLGVSRGGRKVAVKILRAELVTDAAFRGRFAREVAAARTVNGFYTAPVIDADPEATPPWMVTAYVEGPSLAAAVAERGPFSEPEVRDLAAALSEGLAAIHEGGLVHRDFKPANIILASDGPRIIDFGIARAVGTSTMTAQGTIVGTFTYMSPEQVTGSTVGPQSDVFSLGSVLTFAATGHGPFDAETLPAIMHRIFSQPPDLTGIPASLQDLVTGCLDKDPAQRPSLEELLTRLADAGTPPGMSVPSRHATVPSTPPPVPAPQPAPAPAFAPVRQPASSTAAQVTAPPPDTQTVGAVAPSTFPGNPPLPGVPLGAAEQALAPDDSQQERVDPPGDRILARAEPASPSGQAVAVRLFAAAGFLASAVGMTLLLTARFSGWQDESYSTKQYASIISSSPYAPGYSHVLLALGLALFSYPAVIALLTLSSPGTGLRRIRSAYLVAIAVAIWDLLCALIFFIAASQTAKKWLDVGFWGVLVTSVVAVIMLRCAEWARNKPEAG
jgi:serine/threonine protein kinase